MGCIFCNIVKGEIPSAKVYEDDSSYAFLDIKPVNPGHILLVPKEHHENLYDVPDALLAKMAPTMKNLAIALKRAVSADGINIGMNNDRAAGQLVFHAHIHIMPRFNNDGHEHWHGTPYREGEMDSTAQKIISNLE